MKDRLRALDLAVLGASGPRPRGFAAALPARGPGICRAQPAPAAPTDAKAIYKEELSKKRKGPVTSPDLPSEALGRRRARSTTSSFEAPRGHALVVLFTIGALRSKLPSGLGGVGLMQQKSVSVPSI